LRSNTGLWWQNSLYWLTK